MIGFFEGGFDSFFFLNFSCLVVLVIVIEEDIEVGDVWGWFLLFIEDRDGLG